MNDCIFCKIVAGKIPSVKIWEDERHMAFLDIFPNTEGMSLVIPKKHFDSDLYEMPDTDICKLMKASKKVAKKLERGLRVQRVSLVVEGMGVNHIHVKLYPLHGLGEKFTEIWAEEKVYFDKYQGYLTTQIGPKKTQAELKKVAKKIKNA